MSVLFILIIASLLLATGFLVCFIWAVRSGQFDDTLTPSLRILSDDRNRISSDVRTDRGAEPRVPRSQSKPRSL